ncbi:thyroid transcription factor 1-associated protein 26 homolog [Anabrus simplex]|uniref:thyroid transcription factor 1-associated protein 26 homolog n=1 Tax=Anabrus simplex TaxID=316456 RepID=UPI0035A319B3
MHMVMMRSEMRGRIQEGESTTASPKRAFDKKKWRERKYSKTFKLQQWEERTRKAALRRYRKELRKTDPSLLQKDLPEQGNSKMITNQVKKKKLTAYQAAELEFQRKKEEKKQKREMALKKQAEREEALQRYRTKKMERYKKLSKKTVRGQPVMGERMKLLLEKIQQQV